MEILEKDLQQAFGRIIYAMAKIDGEVQQIEIDVFKEFIANHEWAESVSLSFEEETETDDDPNKVFLKAMKVFRAHGPSEHYPFFIDLLKKIAEAHDGIIDEEQKLLNRIKEGLLKDVNG